MRNGMRRLLGLAIKQELERGLDATLRRVRACRKSLASVSRHRHMMASHDIGARPRPSKARVIWHSDNDRFIGEFTSRGGIRRIMEYTPKRAENAAPGIPSLRTEARVAPC